ncbi:MAG: O-antigen ligase family protein [Candidatus Buchananbacteria bacterium]
MNNKFNWTKILFWLINFGICTALFAPIAMNSGFFFPFIVPKNLLFRVAVEIIFAAYVLLALIDKNYRPRFSSIVWAVIGYFSITVVSTLFGINILNSLWGNYERMAGLFHNFHLLMLFVVLVGAIRTKDDWYRLFSFTIFISILMSFIGLAQYLDLPFLLKSSGGLRLAATIGNAIYLAVYLMFHLFFLAFFIGNPEKFKLKFFAICFWFFDALLIVSNILNNVFSASDWGMLNFIKSPLLTESLKYPKFFIVYLLLQALIILAWFMKDNKYVIRALLGSVLVFEFFIFWETQTRGAIVGLAAGLLFIALLTIFSKMEKKYKLMGAGVLAALVILPILLVSSKNLDFVRNNPTLNRLAGISMSDITTQSRVVTWQASWQGLTESPKSFLIGYGPENYFYVFNKYFPTVIYRDSGSQIWFDRAHNIIFDISVTSGVIGLAAFMLILGLAIFSLLKEYKKSHRITTSWIFISLIVAYFVQNLLVFDNLNTEVVLFFLLGYIAFVAQAESAGGEEESDNRELPSKIVPSEWLYISAAGILLVLIFCLTFNFKTYVANRDLIQALVLPTTSGTFSQEKIDYFKESIYASPIGQFEARQQLGTYAISVAQDANASLSQKQEVAQLAVDELEKSIAQEPLNARYRLMLAMIYNSLAQYVSDAPQKAISHLEKTLELSPTRPQVYFELGKSYTLLNQVDRAINYYKQGVALSPDVIDAHWNLEMIYIISGRFTEASQEFETMKSLNWEPSTDDYHRLAVYYDRVKNTEQVILALKNIVRLDPTIQNYGQVADYYARVGDNKNSEAVVAEIIKLFPEAKNQAEAFLEKLRQGELKQN